ncbi:MAG: hypothetical protein ISS77_01795 [Phycisphaerae bacterium]|nr:hypothetical protein [Phycisphaerae bacterium]
MKKSAILSPILLTLAALLNLRVAIGINNTEMWICEFVLVACAIYVWATYVKKYINWSIENKLKELKKNI